MKKLLPEKLYVIIALIFGVLFVFLTPPLQSPDEDSHFKKAYLVSKGDLYPKVVNKQIGNDIPVDLLEYINNKMKFSGDRDLKYKYSDFVSEQYSISNYNNKTFSSYSTASHLFIAYVPASFGIVTAKIFAKIIGMSNISIPYMLYFARLFSLMFSIFIVYHAIRITPILKKTMVTVALMPMSLFLMSMITYDSIVISISLLTAAYILRLIYDDSITKFSIKDLIFLICCGFILFNYKVVYCSIFVLLLFVPEKKFGTLKNKIVKFSYLAGSILLLTFLFKLPLLLLPEVTDSSSKLVNSQISFVKNNLGQYFHILFDSILSQRLFQLTSMVGMFGLIDTYLPLPVIFIYLILLLCISIFENNSYLIKKSHKIALLLTILLSILAIFSVMYISWTPKVVGKTGTKEIIGVQGRYFIPLLFPFLLILSNNKFKKLEKYTYYYILVIILCLILSVLTILLRFWI